MSTIKTYKYTYPSDWSITGCPPEYKYYTIDGTINTKEIQTFIKYSQLIRQPLYITFGTHRWNKDDIKVEQHLSKYGAYYTLIERTIVKDLKRIGQINLEYKYKKKKDEKPDALPLV